jgi:hypothetical protein
MIPTAITTYPPITVIANDVVTTVEEVEAE